ncbi:ABC transporter ATP-binding protein [Paracoccus sediminicola]|uniref:ABC transporter ATP-binding protein n=1 Tax=Paracoccus sediminicola TaxID=3017783 RepID=UPI0022EFFA82|nr:ABC transporter ATP-binding protein [Paracoccus sediminicola]WBU56216.1 ABC transporter ATP-binding protein [Paracoccus sediminicola]
MSISDPILTITDLTADYGGNRALVIGKLTVRRGELLGVVGPNGAGKSTLVGAILGWSRGDPKVSGRVELDGEDVSQMSTAQRVRRGLLLIPESTLIFSQMSVADNLAHAATNPGAGRDIYSLDDIYDLFPNLAKRRHHLGSQLSGGERQMLGIARALRLAPRVLCLDEPSIGLAPKLVSSVLSTIHDLANDGLTVLLIEQNVEAALKVVDRLMLLERGRIVTSGTADEMREDKRIAEAYLGAAA